MMQTLSPDTDTILRAALSDIGVIASQKRVGLTAFVPSGARDNALVSIAGTFANAVTRGERSLLEAIGQVRMWAENFTEKLSGDCVSPDKAEQKLIEFILRDNQNGRPLPNGWDQGLSPDQKEALGVSDLRETRSGPCHELNDTGNGRRFADKYRNRVRYEVDARTWRIWSGTHWKEDRTREVERLAQEVVGDIDREADLISEVKTKGAVRAWAKKSGDRARLVSMVNLAGADPTIACLSTNFDDVPGLLPVLNGVVDLRSGALLPHDSSRLIGKLVEYEYHPTRKGARFEAVLSRALPNKDVQRLFQRSLGYALHGDPVEQRFFVVQGRGANSKSLLFDTAAEVVRAWVVKTPSATFLQKDNEPNTRPDLVRLQGSRIVIGSEVPNRRKLDATIVKVLTGDSEVTARPLYFAEKTFRRTFVPYMITNPLPPGDEVDRALWRRLVLIPFDVVIPEEERDPNLMKTLLREEPEAILAWLIQGAVDYAKFGLQIPEVVRKGTAEWRCKVGSIERFLIASCHKNKDSQAVLSMLHTLYQNWCRGRSIHPVGIESFRDRIDGLGYSIDDTDGGEFVVGIKIGKTENLTMGTVDPGGRTTKEEPAF